MAEHLHGIPRATVERSFLTWILWAIPVAAVVLCIYFILADFVFSGPTIKIYFTSTEGLQEKNSEVKFLGINVGQVESLTIAKDRRRVIVEAKLNRSAADLARAGSLFWIVHPRVSLAGVSGLQTVVAGDYVAVEPGNGIRTNVFDGLEEQPIPSAPALHLTLLTRNIGAIQEKTPILYGGVQIGEVLGCHLAKDATTVVINARILHDYAPLVRVDSEFWNAGGINIHAGLFSGLNISAESAQTVISGGIGVATPNQYGSPATNGAVFILNDKQDESWKDWWPAIPLQNVPEIGVTTNNLPENLLQ